MIEWKDDKTSDMVKCDLIGVMQSTIWNEGVLPLTLFLPALT